MEEPDPLSAAADHPDEEIDTVSYIDL